MASDEDIPFEEGKKLAAKSIKENMQILEALAEYDRRKKTQLPRKKTEAKKKQLH